MTPTVATAQVPQLLPDIHQTSPRSVKTTTIASKQNMSLPSLSPVSVWGTRWRPEPAQSRPHQLPADQEAHQRGRSEGGNSQCDCLLLRSLKAARLTHPSQQQSGTQTDEVLPYLASSLVSLSLSIRLPSWTSSWTDTVWRFPKWPTV